VIGGVVLALAQVLTRPPLGLRWAAHVLAGLIGGAIRGSLFHKGLSISKDELAKLDTEFDSGKAAVGLMVDQEEAALVSAKLIELGGAPEAHEVSDAAVENAAAAVEAAPAEDAAPEAPAFPNPHWRGISNTSILHHYGPCRAVSAAICSRSVTKALKTCRGVDRVPRNGAETTELSKM
jgi:hypothetical protein